MLISVLDHGCCPRRHEPGQRKGEGRSLGVDPQPIGSQGAVCWSRSVSDWLRADSRGRSVLWFYGTRTGTRTCTEPGRLLVSEPEPVIPVSGPDSEAKTSKTRTSHRSKRFQSSAVGPLQGNRSGPVLEPLSCSRTETAGRRCCWADLEVRGRRGARLGW